MHVMLLSTKIKSNYINYINIPYYNYIDYSLQLTSNAACTVQ